MKSYDTLSQAINSLNQAGYKEDFQTQNGKIVGSFSKKAFNPEDLLIVETYRFDGMTNPQDESTVFAIEATDGTKGTMIISYSAEHDQNMEILRRIKMKD